MRTLEKINNLLKEKKFYIEKHFYGIENKFYRIKKAEIKKNGDRVNIYLVYDTPMIPNILHGYEYGTKEKSGLEYLLKTLEDRIHDDGIFYCGKGIDKLVYQN